MDAVVSGGGFEFQTESVQGTWRWTVRANNLQGVGQLYEVVDIGTPHGPLYRTQIPIPGDVVDAMAKSLSDLRDQLAPLLALVSGSQTAFNLIITEGDPDEEIGSVTAQNSGAFGSFMGVTATPSTSWLAVSPTSAQGLGKGEQVTFDLSIFTATLLASGSPYAGVVNLQDDRSSPTVIPIAVTVTVLPRPVIAVSPAQIDLTFVLSTSTAGPPKILSVSNSGPVGSQLEYTVAKVDNNSSWLSISPLSGGPIAPGGSEQVTFSVVAAQAPAVPGTYQETVRVSSPNASNSPVDVVVRLVVT